MAKKKNPLAASEEPRKKVIYTIKLTDEQMEKLNAWCLRQLWTPYAVDYAKFAYKGSNVNVVGYNSGKLVVQGKGTEEFIQFVLEPEITQEIAFGYDIIHHPEWFEPHAGLDESGKGDLFGPLVTATVIADKAMVEHWQAQGLQDSKRITSDAAILRLEKIIRNTDGVVIEVVKMGMEKYNELYVKFGENMNKLLAWMHAKGLEAALKKRHVPWGMLDQFSKQPLVQKLVKVDGFELKMETKAERDPVVAAASVIARAEYVKAISLLSEDAKVTLKKGAGAQVKAQAKELVANLGPDALPRFAKMHFRTAFEVLGLPVPEKVVWTRR